jgi:N-acetylglucosaminyl-diphospho-decaprenol L-rhamnosyltransferase
MTLVQAVTAVVVDWNLPDHTLRCVDSLVHDGMPAERIVVVENDPTDENWSRIRAGAARCVLVRLGANVGFARANNIGARALPGEAYLLVNNDAFVQRPGTVSALLEALGPEEVGMVVPRLLNPDLTLQPTVVPFTTPLPALVRATGLSRFAPDRWQPRLSTHWSHDRSREIEAAAGAVMLVRGATWEQLGGLREASFMFAEDIDLCWRAREAGWKTWFCDEAEFIHLGGTSSDLRWNSRERWARIGRAEGAMIRDHLLPGKAELTLAIVRAGLAARVACFSLVGKRGAAASCRGFLEGLGERGTAAQRQTIDGVAAVEIVRPES